MTRRLPDNNLGSFVEPSARVGFIKQVALALMLGLALGPAALAQADAELKLDRADFDFGLVPDNSTLVYRTWLRATGKDTLEISDIKTGCSCLSVPLEKNRLAPGDSVLLTVQWRVGKAEGPVERVPYLFSNDNTGPHRLKLQANVVPPDNRTSPVTCRPQMIKFDKSDRRKDNRKVFTIQNSADSDRAVSLVSKADEGFQVEFPDTVAAGSSATGIVILKNTSQENEFEGSLTLEFRGGDEAFTRVSIAVTRGDFSFRPTLTTSINTADTDNIKR